MFTTHLTLLMKVKEGDDEAWNSFRDIYRPLIFHCAEQSGLPTTAYPELEQSVLIAFFKACENFEYDPKKGRFRSYLGTLIRNCISVLLRKSGEMNFHTDVTTNMIIENDFEKIWEKEWKFHLFWLAMNEVKKELPEKTVKAFELCDLKNVSAHTAAVSLKISTATLYNYRRKVLMELKRRVEELKRSGELGK